MADPVCLERLERTTHRRRADDLACMGHRREAVFLRRVKRRRERFRRVEVFLAAEADADDAALSVLDCVPDGLERFFERGAAGDVRRQAHLDVVALSRLRSAFSRARTRRFKRVVGSRTARFTRAVKPAGGTPPRAQSRSESRTPGHPGRELDTRRGTRGDHHEAPTQSSSSSVSACE